MGTLDRYITRLYVSNIFLIFVFLCLVIVAVDFSLNFDEFTKAATQVLETRGTTVSFLSKGLLAVSLVVDLWWPRLFLLFNFLLGPVLVGAMGFTCAYLLKHRELVAMLAGGVSMRRIARPILIVTIVMVGLLIVNREIVLPRLAPLLTREKADANCRIPPSCWMARSSRWARPVRSPGSTSSPRCRALRFISTPSTFHAGVCLKSWRPRYSPVFLSYRNRRPSHPMSPMRSRA